MLSKQFAWFSVAVISVCLCVACIYVCVFVCVVCGAYIMHCVCLHLYMCLSVCDVSHMYYVSCVCVLFVCIAHVICTLSGCALIIYLC